MGENDNFNKKDFRIKEQDNLFIIQKRIDYFDSLLSIIIQKPIDKWINYDNNCSMNDIIVNPLGKFGYRSLEAATKRLEKILEEPKYHYL